MDDAYFDEFQALYLFILGLKVPSSLHNNLLQVYFLQYKWYYSSPNQFVPRLYILIEYLMTNILEWHNVLRI